MHYVAGQLTAVSIARLASIRRDFTVQPLIYFLPMSGGELTVMCVLCWSQLTGAKDTVAEKVSACTINVYVAMRVRPPSFLSAIVPCFEKSNLDLAR